MKPWRTGRVWNRALTEAEIKAENHFYTGHGNDLHSEVKGNKPGANRVEVKRPEQHKPYLNI